jgi:hypothetical protein
MSYTRIEHAGGAPDTTLASGISNVDTSLSLTSGTAWPTGGTGPFYLVVDPGTAAEEKILATARATNSLTGLTRGVDGTSASAHSSGAVCKHILSAVEADEANQSVVNTIGKVTTKGDLLVASGANALARLGVGSDNLPLTALASATNGLTFQQVVTGGIADSAVTSAQIADSAVTSAKIADGTIVLADLTSTLRPVQIVTSGTHPGSPAVGDIIFETDTGNLLEYQSVTTGFTRPWNTAWGELAYAEKTAAQGPITSIVDVSGLDTGAVTVVANRKLVVEGFIARYDSSVASTLKVLITDNSGNSKAYMLDGTATDVVRMSPVWGVYRFVSTAGTVQFKVRASATAGATVQASAVGSEPGPAFIRLVDQGPSGAPA